MAEITELLRLVTEIFNSRPAIIATVVSAVVGMFLWRLTVFIVTRMLKREICIGEIKAMAVSYKAIHDDISPEKAKELLESDLEHCK